MPPLPVGGVRLSDPLAQLTLCREGAVRGVLASALGRLAERHINIRCLALARGGAEGRPGGLSLCVDEADAGEAETLLQSSGALAGNLHVMQNVVQLTVFPHRRQVALLSRLLGWMRQAGVPVLAVATSVASVGLVLPLPGLERALDRMEEHLALPPNHAPLVSPLRVVQVDPGEIA